MASFYELRGQIISTGFASGERVVVGVWADGPVGPMNDIMWARPDGRRVLIAPTQAIADFITAIYEFDEVQLDDVQVMRSAQRLRVRSSRLDLSVVPGRRWPIPLGRWRRRHFVRLVESPLARRAMQVRTYGVTARGVREWYRADALSYVRQASLAVDGVDAGLWGPVRPGLRVGVTEPPARASITDVRPLLFDPAGTLDGAIARARMAAR